MTSRTVELHQAYLWTCDVCGRDNFERSITIDPESIDLDDLPDGVDPDMVREWIDGGGEGDFVTAPTRVTCGHCRAVFDVDFGDEDGETP